MSIAPPLHKAVRKNQKATPPPVPEKPEGPAYLPLSPFLSLPRSSSWRLSGSGPFLLLLRGRPPRRVAVRLLLSLAPLLPGLPPSPSAPGVVPSAPRVARAARRPLRPAFPPSVPFVRLPPVARWPLWLCRLPAPGACAAVSWAPGAPRPALVCPWFLPDRAPVWPPPARRLHAAGRAHLRDYSRLPGGLSEQIAIKGRSSW